MIDLAKMRLKSARFYRKHRAKRITQQRAYNEENRAIVNERSRIRSKRPDVMARRNARVRERYAENIAFKIHCSVRVRLGRMVKGKLSRGNALRTNVILGCSLLEFKIYIENQFQRGMSWENYGPVWHLDHKIPCALFDMTDKKQVAQCFNYLNYQPLWASENMSKRHVLQRPEQIALGL